MLAVLASYGYFIWALVGVFFNIDTFYPHMVVDHFFKSGSPPSRIILNLLEIHVSIRAEMPLHLLVMKISAIALTGVLGGFGNDIKKKSWDAGGTPKLVFTRYFFFPFYFYITRLLAYMDYFVCLGYSESIGVCLLDLGNGARETSLLGCITTIEQLVHANSFQVH